MTSILPPVREYDISYKNAKNSIVKKWFGTGVFKGLSEFDQLNLATLMENARLSDGDSIFARIVLSVTFKFYQNLVSKNIVSFQPVNEKWSDYCFYDDIDDELAEVKKEKANIIIRDLQTKYHRDTLVALRGSRNADDEMEIVSAMAEESAAELDREVIRDLSERAKHRWWWDYETYQTLQDKHESLDQMIYEMSIKIACSTQRSIANWLITSKDICDLLTQDKTFSVSKKNKILFGINEVGKIRNGDITVYQDDLFPRDKILMGYKGSNNYDAGYFLCPKLLFSYGVYQHPIQHCRIEYGKSWYNYSFYGIISIDNI